MLECCPEERIQICYLGSRSVVQLLERVRDVAWRGGKGNVSQVPQMKQLLGHSVLQQEGDRAVSCRLHKLIPPNLMFSRVMPQKLYGEQISGFECLNHCSQLSSEHIACGPLPLSAHWILCICKIEMVTAVGIQHVIAKSRRLSLSIWGKLKLAEVCGYLSRPCRHLECHNSCHNSRAA